MDTKWAEDLLINSQRLNKKQEENFLKLVDAAFNKCTLDVARTLMKTFSAKPDYGTQERVVSVLGTGEERIVTQVILEELPRLLGEAPDWAEVLVGTEVEHRPYLLVELAKKMPENQKIALKQLLNNEEFQDLFPNSLEISRKL